MLSSTSPYLPSIQLPTASSLPDSVPLDSLVLSSHMFTVLPFSQALRHRSGAFDGVLCFGLYLATFVDNQVYTSRVLEVREGCKWQRGSWEGGTIPVNGTFHPWGTQWRIALSFWSATGNGGMKMASTDEGRQKVMRKQDDEHRDTGKGD
ncbi:hypothetical protein BDN70DRAFT_898612 [Pholiota conissans]|uniref:Uncharacterized protein n=1 Tax=Pholiota conissans TaxID=109636 RepID=A0A9P5YSS6_9AGAR|nr:hypothetical protein BDN70DRAFT_898612 [Pholiota conissans]